MCLNTFGNADVAAKVTIPKQSPEGHVLETNPLQFREALQVDRCQTDAALRCTSPGEVTLKTNKHNKHTGRSDSSSHTFSVSFCINEL